jgi:hypothetical protein
MKQPLIQTKQYLLLNGSNDIKEGDYFFANQAIRKCIRVDDNSTCPYITLQDGKEIGHFKTWKPILAHLPLTKEAQILEGVMLLPTIGSEYDIDKLTKEIFIDSYGTEPIEIETHERFLNCIKKTINYLKTPKFFTAEMEQAFLKNFKEPNLIHKKVYNAQGKLELVGTYSIE